MNQSQYPYQYHQQPQERGESFFQNSIIQWLLISIIFFNGVVWAVLRFFIVPGDYAIILQYNAFFGVERFEHISAVYTLPAMGIIFFVLNITLGAVFYSLRERIAAHMLLLATILFHISVLIASLAIIVVNR